MKIHFCSSGNEWLASHRLRCQIPAEQLIRRGLPATVGPQLPESARVVVFSKHIDYTDWDKALLARHRGQRVVLDICNDHLSAETPHTRHYQRMLALADLVTCNSVAMASVLRNHAKVAVEVIPDPYETPDTPRTYRGGQRLLWFGHPHSLPALREILPSLAGYPLEVCTAPLPPLEHNGPLRMTEYRPGILPQVFERNDIAIIPGSPHDSWHWCKSPNRAVEAIRGGLYVVASLTAALDAWPRIVWVGDIAAGVRDAIARPSAANEALQRGKLFVDDRYAPQTVGAVWEDVLRG